MGRLVGCSGLFKVLVGNFIVPVGYLAIGILDDGILIRCIEPEL